MADKNYKPSKPVVINDREEGTESRFDIVRRLYGYGFSQATPPNSSSSVHKATQTPAYPNFTAANALTIPTDEKNDRAEEGGPAQVGPNLPMNGALNSNQKESSGGDLGNNQDKQLVYVASNR